MNANEYGGDRRLPEPRLITLANGTREWRVAVGTIEAALGEAWSVGRDDLRKQLWKNLACICARTRTSSMLPRRLQANLLTV